MSLVSGCVYVQDIGASSLPALNLSPLSFYIIIQAFLVVLFVFCCDIFY